MCHYQTKPKKIFMKIKKDKNSVIKEYTLHDARVQNIEFTKNTIVLKLDCITSYPQGKETYHKADIILENTDIKNCEVLVFDKVIDPCKNSNFSGNCLQLTHFLKQYTHFEFEIIDEIYNGNSIIFRGWLYLNEPVTCIMEFWSEGDFIYDIHEKIQ